ncbi:MAG: Abi family protein [Candidatus Sabulitectum sp.]|nr:Abi family protein [Candidatus Sabulitectum sp.]
MILLVSVAQLSSSKGCHGQRKLDVSKDFSVSEILLESWLVCLIDLRNLCAHHNRLWNRGFGKSPKRPDSQKKYPDWYTPVRVFQSNGNVKLFPFLTVLQ